MREGSAMQRLVTAVLGGADLVRDSVEILS